MQTYIHELIRASKLWYATIEKGAWLKTKRVTNYMYWRAKLDDQEVEDIHEYIESVCENTLEVMNSRVFDPMIEMIETQSFINNK